MITDGIVFVLPIVSIPVSILGLIFIPILILVIILVFFFFFVVLWTDPREDAAFPIGGPRGPERAEPFYVPPDVAIPPAIGDAGEKGREHQPSLQTQGVVAGRF